MARRSLGILAAVGAAVLAVLILAMNWTLVTSFGLASGDTARFAVSVLPLILLPLLGADLLRRELPLPAAAVLATTAAMMLPLVASSALLVLGDPASTWTAGALLHFGLFGALLTAAAVAARLVAAWPRRRPLGVVPALAGLAALAATIWPVVWRVPGQRSGEFAEQAVPIVARIDDPSGSAVYLLATLITAAVLFFGATTGRRVGALVLVVAVLPALLDHLVTAGLVASEAALAVSPAGWVAITGQVTLLVLAALWWLRHDGDRAGTTTFASADRALRLSKNRTF